MPMHRWTAVCAVACALASVAWPAPTRAQSVHNLERGLPIEAMDTAVTDTGKVQVQGSAINETSETQDRFSLQPNVQWGFAENAHLFVNNPYYLGDESVQSGSGDIFVGILYNFLAEGKYLPSAAVQGELVAPTGVGSDGLDSALTFVLTKQITKEASEDRIHFNLRWDHNSVAGDDERKDRFEYVIGYSRKVTDKAVLAIDFFRRDELQEGQASNVMEIGMLYQLSQHVTVGAGIGTGIDEDSPDFRLWLSLQVTLGG
jgi:hypothetical protein